MHTKDCQPLKEPVWEREREAAFPNETHDRVLCTVVVQHDQTSSHPPPHLYPILGSDKSPTNAWIRILSKGISICKTALFQEPIYTVRLALDDTCHIFTDCRLVLFLDISECVISLFHLLCSKRYGF